MGRQKEQMHMLRHNYVVAGMPARLVEDEHDLLGGTRADRLGKGRELGREEVDADARGQMPNRAA
jgi:hypothetical protein